MPLELTTNELQQLAATLQERGGNALTENIQGQQLVKFGNDYYLLGKEIGKGSNDVKVRDVPYIFNKMEDGHYQAMPVKDTVIKASPFAGSEDFLRQNYPNAPDLRQVFQIKLEHEAKMLKGYGDDKAAIVVDDSHTVFVKMEKAEGIPLYDYLHANPNLPFQERLRIIEMIASVVERMHKNGICHLDMKPENIIYNPENGTIKLIDFGSAQEINADLNIKPLPEHVTTREFDPPDHNNNTPLQIDSYSLAVIFGEILKEPKMSLDNIQKITILGKETMKQYGYDYNKLRKVSYLQESEKPQMEQMIYTLSKLGNYEKAKRGTNFHEIAKSHTPSGYCDKPINQLSNEQLTLLYKSLDQWLTDHKDELHSTQPSVVALKTMIRDSQHGVGKMKGYTQSPKALLEDVLKDGIKKQSSSITPKFFKSVSHLGGSNVLRAMLDLPEDIKGTLDPKLLKDAKPYTQNIMQRKMEGITKRF